jgi:outer membrane receptor for ferrienterochelin and colicin
MGSSEPEFYRRTEGSRKRNSTHQHTTHKEERREGDTSRKKGFYSLPLAPKLFGLRLKGALVPV